MNLSEGEITPSSAIHRYATEHWSLLHSFSEGPLTDPRGNFLLSSDTWDCWPYARNGTPSQAARYRLSFAHLSSFLKPFVKWYCYQQILQRADNVRTTLKLVPHHLKRVDTYLLHHGYTSLDDLAPLSVFEALWAALLPHKDPPFLSHEVNVQSAIRPFWLQMHAIFGIPVLVPPVTPSVRPLFTETGRDERAVIPQPVIANLMNMLALHREGKTILNRFHHLRLCILLLHICLGRRMNEILLASRGSGSEGPLTSYPARGKGKDGGLWFSFEPNKDGQQNQVYVSTEWQDLVHYCTKSILFYSDEVRHLALPEEQHFFILVSNWNRTSGSGSAHSRATEHDLAYDHIHFNAPYEKRSYQIQRKAQPLSYQSFFCWLAGYGPNDNGQHDPDIFHLWNITVDGKSDGAIYHMRTHQARHTRQTALAQDPTILPLIRQRDLNHTSQNMQLVYQHQLRLENTRLRERIAERQLHGLGTNWLEQCLGLREPTAETAWRLGQPTLLDTRWQALMKNNPQFIQANRVPCGLCSFPQGPEGCPEFLHCTEATDKGCAWFLTDPNDVHMQKELQQRASEHRQKQQESMVAGRMVQAHKYSVMAERTERLREEALHKASDEVRQALLDELNTSQEG